MDIYGFYTVSKPTCNPTEQPNYGRRWTAKLDDELLRMVLFGKTTAECAAQLGRSESSVEFRKLRHTRELIAKGLSVEDASKRTKLSETMIEEHLRPVEYDSDDYLEALDKSRRVVGDDKYKNGKIYELTFGDAIIYRGSTIQTLKMRLKNHRTASLHGDLSAYIKKVGPQNIAIRLVELYPCKTLDELLARERILIREQNHNQDLLNIKHRYNETQSFIEMIDAET